MTAEPASARGLARRFARDWLAPQWRWLALGVIFSALTAAAAYGYAEITTRAVDWLKDGDPRVFTIAPAAILALVLLRSSALFWQTQANNIGVQRALIHLQHRLFEKLISGDFSRLQAAASGAYVSRFSNDVQLIREASLRVATNLARSSLTVAACVLFMLLKDWPLALLLIVVYPVAFWPVVRLGDRIRRTSRVAQEQAGELSSFLTEAFQGARTVKAYSLEGRQIDRARSAFEERARLYLRILRSKALVDPFLEVMGGVALAGLFAFAGWRALAGEASVGEVIGFITAIGVASPEVRALGTLNSVLNEGVAAADRVYQELDQPSRVVDRPGAQRDFRSSGLVEADQVVFSYPGGAERSSSVLNGFTFRAEPGAVTALVGPSGSGKSTVFNLLLRLYDADAGQLRLDGVDLRSLSLSSLRGCFALVSQDAFLFEGTIRDNILLGRPGASSDDVLRVAREAACHFIDEAPLGLETPVGEGGRNLSGGQRQRVALARALLSVAPILLLDEATSALDSESEALVQDALARVAGRRTIIVVAHRLATVRAADRIFVLSSGRVVESGRHEELIALGGRYAELASGQLT